MHDDAIDALFDLIPEIRYVAFGHGQLTTLRERAALRGGLRFLVVGYGNFHQLVIPLAAGHVSIAFELDSDPLDHLPAVTEVLAARELVAT